MKVIIDIPEEYYNAIKAIPDRQCLVDTLIIKYGKPLPKGHGRLGDLDAVKNDISTSIDEMTSTGVAVDGDYLWAKLNDAIDNASTIIEADKEDSENDRL